MEIVAEFLGLDTGKAIHLFFRRHYGEWFPALGEVHRTTFARQAANLWKIKERLWQELLALTPHETPPSLSSTHAPARVSLRPRLPLPPLPGEAAFGKDTLLRQTFYGFRVHARVSWPGVITRFSVAPANAADNRLAPLLIEALPEEARFVLGDSHYNAPNVVREACLAQEGRFLVASGRGPYPHVDAGVEVRRVFHRLRQVSIENFNGHFKTVFDAYGEVPTKGRTDPRASPWG